MKPLVAIVLAVALMVAAGRFSAQAQPPAATLDDLLAEVRGLRSELRQAAGASMQAQLVLARLTSQEGRIGTLSQQLANVRQQLSQAQLGLTTFAGHLKETQDRGETLPDSMKLMMEQMQKQEKALRAQESELAALIAAEQNRWLEFNARLDEIERGLAGR